MIRIVAKGDTLIVHYPLSIVNFYRGKVAINSNLFNSLLNWIVGAVSDRPRAIDNRPYDVECETVKQTWIGLTDSHRTKASLV